MRKLTLLVAGGIGYVLGTRAGRERYDQIVGAARKVKDNPTVQEKAHQAAGVAQEKAHQAADVAREKAPVVADKVKDAAATASEKVRPSGSSGSDGSSAGSDLTDQLNPESTARQADPYPKGDLP